MIGFILQLPYSHFKMPGSKFNQILCNIFQNVDPKYLRLDKKQTPQPYFHLE